MNVPARRVDALRRLVGAEPSIAAFARKYGLDATYISQLLNGHRSFGERAAAKMAEQVGLPAGYFEQIDAQPTTDEWESLDDEQLARVAQLLFDELIRRLRG